MSSFIKPKIDTTLYLWSKNAKKDCNGYGIVNGITLLNAGSGYTSMPNVYLNGGDTGDTASAVASAGVVNNISLDNAGTGYTTVPSVIIDGGGGSGATATATINNGSIATITITNAGSGYIYAPSVIITGGGGSGASASATLRLSTLTITNGGTGYLYSPSVSFVGGGGTGGVATATLSGTITQYPRQPLMDFNNVYVDGTVVRVKASSDNTFLANTESWRLFDYNPATRWLSAASTLSPFTGISTDTTQYFNNDTTFHGQWAMLDLGIFLDYYKIALGLSSTLQGRKLVNFRIYATNDSASWNNTKSGNWVQIQEVNDPSILRDGNTTFTVGNYQTAYRYYAIIVYKIMGNGDRGELEIREWELYGIPAKNKCIQYSWDIPPITLNQNGKISMEAKAYNTFAPTTIATTTTIKNIGSSKYNYSSKSNGTIIDASHWAYSKKKNTKCPAVVLQPQTINNISLSIVPEDNQKGVDNDSDFVAVLKITEDDLPITRYN